MKLLNDKGDDLSNESIVLMAMMLEMAWAMQIVGARALKALDALGVNRSFFHEKQNAFTNSKKYMDLAIKQLDFALDDKFRFIFDRVPEHVKERSNAIQWQANEIIQVLLIMYSRSDSDFAKRERMKKALMNFKPDPDTPVDLDSMMRFFRFKTE